MNTVLIRTFVENRRQPLNRLDSTASQLDELCQLAPEFCVLVIGDERTHVTQRSQLLAGLVRSSIKREKIVTQLLKVADGDLLRMLDGLRRRRLNGRRVRELGLASLVPRPHFAQVAAHHRTRVVRIFKHLLGERTWSSIRRFLTVATPDGDRFVHAKVLRFAADTAKAREVLCFLAGLGFDQRPSTRRPWLIVPWFNKPERLTISFDNEGLRQSVAARRALYGGEGMPRETLSGIRGTYHPDASAKVLRSVAAPAKPRHLVDGPLTQALKRAMAENDSTSLDQLVDRASAIGSFPQVDVRAAVVLDLSSSTMSSGERLFHPAALGLALVGLLERTVRDLKLFQVGGSIVLDGHGVPRPSGATDLATAREVKIFSRSVTTCHHLVYGTFSNGVLAYGSP